MDPTDAPNDPMERLWREELPTGTFGDARPATPRTKARLPTPGPVAAEHRRILLAALASRKPGRPRHLRSVPPPKTTTPASHDGSVAAVDAC